MSFFLATVMSTLFFLGPSIGCSVTSTMTPWMLVWLSSNSLLLGSRNCRHWINLFSTRCMVRKTVDLLLGRCGTEFDIPSNTSMSSAVGHYNVSLAGLPLLVGENKVDNICRKTPTLTPVNRLKSDSDRSFICCYLIL